MKDWISNIVTKVYSIPNKDYKDINNEDEYFLSFGLEKKDNKWKISKADNKKIKYAYERAWANRDFEINKFWTRAAYFWGFIVLIFGAYFKTLDSKENIFLQLVIICLGIIFSIAWHYVIRGSKRWQENWEKHIDMLEDFISGPLYKTIYYKNTFYSVSKINEILSVVIIIVWIALLSNYCWTEKILKQLDFKLTSIFIMTIIFSIVIIFGYSQKKYKNEKRKFIRRKPSA